MDPEIQAMSSVSDALVELDELARARVLRWAADKYGINVGSATKPQKPGNQEPDEVGEIDAEPEDESVENYGSFAEFFAAASPSNESEKVLVAGYWFQVEEGQADLTSAQLNKELKHLGHSITNINQKFDTLKGAKPQLAIQLKKSGSAKQARKKYKITQAGISRVQELLGS